VTQLDHLPAPPAAEGDRFGGGPPRRAGVVVVGAGLGGLLAALRLAREGREVVLVERADRPGGRFTATSLRGAEVSTGALHLLPNGSGGALARLLRELEVPIPIAESNTFCSVWVDGEHVLCPRGRDVVRRVLSARERRTAGRLAIRLLTGRGGTCEAWLGAAAPSRSRLHGLWRAFSEFALSLPLDRVTVPEMRSVALRSLRDGLPGVPKGGCRGVVDALVRALQDHGGRLLLDHEVERIVVAPGPPPSVGRVVGIEARERGTGRPLEIRTPLVVSDIGPGPTLRLCGLLGARSGAQLSSDHPTALGSPATGLKIQLLSPVSLVPHRSVMFCLGTERVAGVTQPSNGDPDLAPPGRHLVMSHQVLGGDSIAEGRAAGLRDLRRIFGSVLDRCEVLSAAGFRGEWPVNRAAQGQDILAAPSVAGLQWVGDGHKPAGYIMVEGVAESVRRLRITPARRGLG
jgi:phytoene dehydrogenase-like protein